MRKIIPIIFACITVMAGCTSLDCPLNNTVYCKYRLQGSTTRLADTLTISTPRRTGTDSVIVNKDVNTDSIVLPMSYSLPADTFFFETRDTLKRTFLDTVIVKKENYPHFESIDCSPAFFHTITGVQTTHHRIDSISINCKEVTYDETKSHFYIYFGYRD